jgi:WD40 repeat protein
MRILATTVLVVLAGLTTMSAAGCSEGGARHQRLTVLDLETGKSRTVSSPDRTVHAAVWLPDSSALLVIEGGTPGGYFLAAHDARSGVTRWEVEGAMESGRPLAAAVSPDGREVAVLRDSLTAGERRGELEFIDATTGTVLRTTGEWETPLTSGFTPDAGSVAWTPSGRVAVVSHNSGGFNDVRWFEAATAVSLGIERTAASEVFAIANAINDRVVVFAVNHPVGADEVTLYDGGTSRTLDIPAGGNFALDFASNGDRLAIAAEGRVYVYDIVAGTLDEVAGVYTQGLSWGTTGRIALAWGSEVFSIAGDGGDRQSHANVDGGKTVRHPVWSPDGKKLAYVVEPPYRD